MWWSLKILWRNSFRSCSKVINDWFIYHCIIMRTSTFATIQVNKVVKSYKSWYYFVTFSDPPGLTDHIVVYSLNLCLQLYLFRHSSSYLQYINLAIGSAFNKKNLNLSDTTPRERNVVHVSSFFLSFSFFFLPRNTRQFISINYISVNNKQDFFLFNFYTK